MYAFVGIAHFLCWMRRPFVLVQFFTSAPVAFDTFGLVTLEGIMCLVIMFTVSSLLVHWHRRIQEEYALLFRLRLGDVTTEPTRKFNTSLLSRIILLSSACGARFAPEDMSKNYRRIRTCRNHWR